MKRATEIALLEELLGLKEDKIFYLDEGVQHSPIERYSSPDRFQAEVDNIFKSKPMIAAHSSELAEPGTFITMTLIDLPILLTRDKAGQVHGYLNVCRHRGARLEASEKGCKHAFTCPYHAWTYSNKGDLKGVPHQRSGFPDLDKSQFGLKRVPVAERFGFIWAVADPSLEVDFDAYLAPLAEDFEWLKLHELAIAATHTEVREANWKLLVEGGIEAYHFKVTHRDTIGPHFLDNLSSYRMLGKHHMRSVLPRNSLLTLKDRPQGEWDIRDHANVLYTVFPADQFLVMQDHIAWIHLRPLAHDQSEIRITTLAAQRDLGSEMDQHWKRNHQITKMTLDEDFAVNADIQRGINSGANDVLTFGRYEGALAVFNKLVEDTLLS